MYIHLTIKLIVGFLALFFATKFIGGRELKQLNVFDFISAIVLSELVGNVLYQDKVNFLHMTYAILVWTTMIYCVDKITVKSKRIGKFIDGEPDLIIEHSKIDKSILAKHRMDLNELLSLLREKSIFTVREVGYAFIEPDGNLSVIKGTPVSQGTKIPVLPCAIIIDGKVEEKSLHRIGKDQKWLQKEITKSGYSKASQIFYAEYYEGQELLVQEQPSGLT